MALNFPAYEEVHLSAPPLDEVICQVRFPAVLRITREEPSEFQDRIRDRFPVYEREQGIALTFRGPGAEEAPAARFEAAVHRFRDTTHRSTVSLASEFYALSTNAYTGWTSFLAELTQVHEAVVALYAPAYAARIGLRYVNRLTPSNTGRSALAEMVSLVRSDLTCMVSTDVWDEPDVMQCHLVLSDLPAKLGLRAGLAGDEAGPGFVLDFDYFQDGPESMQQVLERCDFLHGRVYSAFRWSLAEGGIEALAAADPTRR